MMTGNKNRIKNYLSLLIIIAVSFFCTKLLLKARYGIELNVFSAESLFLIITSLWLVAVILLLRKLFMGQFRQQVWYGAFILILVKWPIDWGYKKLLVLDTLSSHMWFSLYYPVVWTCVMYFYLYRTRAASFSTISNLKLDS